MGTPGIIVSQTYIFLCSVAGGVVIAFIYDLFRIRRKVFKPGNFLIWLEDLLFWLLVAVVVFAVVFYSNDGELRGYIFIGTLLGSVLYMLLLSRIVTRSALFFLRVVSRIFSILWLILSWPFKLIFRGISIPAVFLGKQLGKSAVGIRRAGRNRFSKTAIWLKALKNIRKKI